MRGALTTICALKAPRVGAAALRALSSMLQLKFAALRALSSIRRGLPQQGAGRLLEDPAPAGALLLRRLEVLDDLAHAGRGDLDAVALGDLAQVVVVGGELDGHVLEAVPRDVEPRRVVEDVRL